MMRLVVIFIALLVGACGLPSREYLNQPTTRVTVAGSTFDIRQRGLRAEAIRINPQYAPRLGRLRNRAAFAMEQASGCTVVDVQGDQAQMFGRLDCGNGPAPKRIQHRELECVPVRGSEIQEIGQIRIDLDCDPV